MRIIKRLLSLILAAALLPGLNFRAYAEGEPAISAERAVLCDENGRILYSKNPHEPSLIASTTKLMTALIVLENCRLQDKVKILPEYCGIEGSSMYLREGEEYSVEELLWGLLLVSGNDAAKALADFTAGSEEKFVRLMNLKARELGMDESHFENPHGLDSEEHYSTASDLGRLMAFCMKNPEFRKITAMGSCRIKDQSYINHNKLLRLCKGCKGGKTGYTLKAGRCLVSCCERQGMRLICVTLSAPDDWNDHIKLYNRAFSEYEMKNPGENKEYLLPLISGEKRLIRVKAEEKKLLVRKNTEIVLKAELPPFVFAPVKKGDRAGKLRIYTGNELIAEAELYFAEDGGTSPHK